jgi:tripartite-type tricarboxylate transporter receptor subunit TctC
MKLIRTLLSAYLLAVVASAPHAQHAARPARTVMPYAAGGTGDILVRKKLGEALQTTEIKEAFAAQGAQTLVVTPGESERILRSDVQRWTVTIRTAGISLD